MGSLLESDSEKMQLFIKNENRTQTLEVEPSVTVAEFRKTIDAGEARLLCAGQELNSEDATLEDFGIQGESTIVIVHRLLGGGLWDWFGGGQNSSKYQPRSFFPGPSPAWNNAMARIMERNEEIE